MNLRIVAAALEFLWRKPRPARDPATRDSMLKTVGHDSCWSERGIKNGVRELHIQGLGTSIGQGDYLMLSDARDRQRSTRYRVQCLSYDGDPVDMFEAVLTFAPREVKL